MTKSIRHLSPAATIQEAALAMRENETGFLPICNNDRQVIGTLTDRDMVLRALADGRAMTTPVEQIMTSEVVACAESEERDKALDLMRDKKVSRIVCLDAEGKLAGVVSMAELTNAPDNTLLETIAAIKNGPGDTTATTTSTASTRGGTPGDTTATPTSTASTRGGTPGDTMVTPTSTASTRGGTPGGATAELASNAAISGETLRTQFISASLDARLEAQVRDAAAYLTE